MALSERFFSGSEYPAAPGRTLTCAGSSCGMLVDKNTEVFTGSGAAAAAAASDMCMFALVFTVKLHSLLLLDAWMDTRVADMLSWSWAFWFSQMMMACCCCCCCWKDSKANKAEAFRCIMKHKYANMV